jgi:hypothetical protein
MFIGKERKVYGDDLTRDGTPIPGRWDSYRAMRANHQAFAQPRTCIHCRRDCRPRYLYCNDTCATASLADTRAAYEKARTH